MTKFDIFSMKPNTKVCVTIRELQRLYFTGESNGVAEADMFRKDVGFEQRMKYEDAPVIVKGDVL